MNSSKGAVAQCLLGAALLIICSGSIAQPSISAWQDSKLSASPAIISQDAYDVYSIVLQDPFRDHRNYPAPLVIENRTGEVYGWQDPSRSIDVPKPYQEKFQQIVNAVIREQGHEFALQPRFQLNREYKLIDGQIADRFRDAIFQRKATAAKDFDQFDGARDLIRLSPVYFSRDHTLAIVLVSNYCGGLCGSQQWRILEKRAGVWNTLNWPTSLTVS